ncbi:MAG: TRAP transporter small permease [Syntrophorhabdaceae bacterium]|nr:TRAP transporter small permease [Syntrophorhabdaceae bacterium]
MGLFMNFVERLCRWMGYVSGFALTFIMLLTVADVFLRLFNRPIVGTFELVGLGGAVVIGFAVPITSWIRGHIFVDFLINGMPKKIRNAFNIATRITGIILFILIGWNLFSYAYSLYKSGEVTLTRQLPFYPIAYGLGICCFIECLVLITDLIKIGGGKYE